MTNFARPLAVILILASASLGAAALPLLDAHDAPAATPAADTSHSSSVPLTFEANRGQAESPVRFLTRADGVMLLFGADDVRIDAGDGTLVRLTFPGSLQARVEGLDPLPGRSNYLSGPDASAWITDIPHYARVMYAGLYPGVDLVFYPDAADALEYDFVVAPGADPAPIRLHFDGARSLHVDETGALLLGMGAGELRHAVPFVYQTRADGARERVEGAFVLESAREVRFALGPYDVARELVIDPTLAYSTYISGKRDDFARGVAVHGNHMFVTGGTASVDFPIKAAYQSTFNTGTMGYDFGRRDVFVTKIDTSASGAASLVYSTFIGGGGDDQAYAIAVDSAGRAFVTGYTGSSDYPLAALTGAPYQSTFNAGGILPKDAFVTVLNAAGNGLAYSTFLGGASFEEGRAIKLRSGSAYVCGDTGGSFPHTTGAHVSGLNFGAFVVRLNPNGAGAADVVWSAVYGGGTCRGLGFDGPGNVFFGGTTNGGIVTTATAYDSTFNGGSDAFVAKLDATGATLLYATYFGGTQQDNVRGFAVGSGANAFLVGSTFGAAGSFAFPVTNGALQTTHKGGIWDGFVVRLDTKLPGTAGLVYATYLGGSESDLPHAVVASGHSAFVTGGTFSPDFPVTTGAYQTAHGGSMDVFVTKLAPSGKTLSESTFVGGAGGEHAEAIALGGQSWWGMTGSAVHVAGWGAFDDTMLYPLTTNAFQLTRDPGADGSYDSFATKFTPPIIVLKVDAYAQKWSVSRTLGLCCVESAPLTFGATLLNDGEPVVGALVEFGARGDTLCEARTDGSGHASCFLPRMAPQVLADGGYWAFFAGDDDLPPASGEASILAAEPDGDVENAMIPEAFLGE